MKSDITLGTATFLAIISSDNYEVVHIGGYTEIMRPREGGGGVLLVWLKRQAAL